MTRDGSSVTFTSEEQLHRRRRRRQHRPLPLERATDSPDPALGRQRQQATPDDCSATWIEGCGVEVPNTERRYGLVEPKFHSAIPKSPTSRRRVWTTSPRKTAATSTSTRPSCSTGSNSESRTSATSTLRTPTAVQFVATLDVGTQVNRMTISPGTAGFAAFLTDVTDDVVRQPRVRRGLPYERDRRNPGLRLVPSRTDRLPRTCTVSQGGKFMADDGRTFFATKDSLVPRDKNGEITDVVRVRRRPPAADQRRRSRSRDFTGEAEMLRPLREARDHRARGGQPRRHRRLLLDLRRRWSTKTTTGQFVKFYDARTNGGFPQPPVDCSLRRRRRVPRRRQLAADAADRSPPARTSGDAATSSPRARRRRRRRSRRRSKKKKKPKRKAGRSEASEPMSEGTMSDD